MKQFDPEALVHDYIVYSYVIKALDHDREKLGNLKLSRAWLELADFLLSELVKQITILKNQMSNHGCRIVLEEIVSGNNVHVMYVYRRYEHHCYMLPYVLKTRCEDILLQLFHRWLQLKD